MKYIWPLILFLAFLTACEDTNYRLIAESGIEAVKAITLSDEEVKQLSRAAADQADAKHRIAPPGSAYAERLQRLVEEYQKASGHTFDYKVYLSPEVNAFAMGDGTIRVYSGLMDIMNDDELRFVIGHEMGHVVEEHIRRKMALALAGSAIRKGVASQENWIGNLARSELGGFLEVFFNAQFSQEEERAADDYGLEFMRREGHPPAMAVSALEKLAEPGGDPNFLSSHPDPENRADRLQELIDSPGQESPEKGILEKLWALITAAIAWLMDLIPTEGESVANIAN